MLSNDLSFASLLPGRYLSHDLAYKIRVTARAGYKGFEIVYFELS
jgi:hypothetical protein